MRAPGHHLVQTLRPWEEDGETGQIWGEGGSSSGLRGGLSLSRLRDPSRDTPQGSSQMLHCDRGPRQLPRNLCKPPANSSP